MIQIRFLSFFAIILFGIHCYDPVKTYPVKGVVVDLKPGEKIVVVDHDTIPDLMMPMVMPFNLKDLKDIDGLSIGDSIHFEFIWADTVTYAKNFRVVGKGQLPETENGFFKDGEYAERKIGETIDDVTLLNLDSSLVRLSDYDGKYRFLSFIFTRCPMPNMCPAVIVKNEVLAKAFQSSDAVEFIMVSFDYLYDSPGVLRDFYGPAISGYDNWKVWSSINHIEDVYRLAKQSGCDFWGIENGKIGHTLRSVLIGPNREMVGSWPGDVWRAGDVKNAIEVLMKL